MVARIPASYLKGSEYDMANKEQSKKAAKQTLKEKREQKRAKVEATPRREGS